MTCAPSEDSDQPGHPPSLIRVFAVRMKKHLTLNYLLSAQWRLWSDWVDTQADLSRCWAHIILMVLSCGSSIVVFVYCLVFVTLLCFGTMLMKLCRIHYFCSNKLLLINSKYILCKRLTQLLDGNWATSWQNQQNGRCTQLRLRSAWASAQSDQSLRCVLSE